MDSAIPHEEFSHNLTNTAPIVENILGCLNARDLNCCTRVCKFWSRCATKLKSRRKTRAWTCLRGNTDQNKSGSKHAGLFEDARAFIQGLYTEPYIVFMTCQTDLLNHRVVVDGGEGEPCNQSRSKVTFKQYVKSLIPPKCHLVCVGSGGIVGTESDLRMINEVENSAGATLLCLPKYAGFEVDISDDIEGNGDEIDSDGSDLSDDDLPESFSSQKISQEAQQFTTSLVSERQATSKVILMFVADFQVPRVIGFDVQKCLPQSLIAGAYVDEIVPKVLDKYPVVQLTAISGENVHIASVIISDNISTATRAEESIKRLKQYNLPEENSFAFMFACLGRGEGLYGEPNIESSLFRKHFPKTPLIGLFGNGEIGFEHCSREQVFKNAPPQTKRPKSSAKLYHAYTTVLVLVSIA